MAIKVLHRETVGLREVNARVAALQAQYPSPATVTFRRLPRYGNGYNITVKGEGPTTAIQLRGHCQFCGRDQALTPLSIKQGTPVLVKHGYKRPGTGYEIGRCPGAGLKPLQVTDADTHRFLAEEHVTLDKLEHTLPWLEQQELKAGKALDASGESSYRANAERPYLRNSSWSPATQAEKDTHEAALKTWAAKYPCYVAHREAIAAVSTQRNAIGQARAFITHFEGLIASKLVGTPLLEVEK